MIYRFIVRLRLLFNILTHEYIIIFDLFIQVRVFMLLYFFSTYNFRYTYLYIAY